MLIDFAVMYILLKFDLLSCMLEDKYLRVFHKFFFEFTCIDKNTIVSGVSFYSYASVPISFRGVHLNPIRKKINLAGFSLL